MKTKKLDKKVVLKKETVANLENFEMKAVKGGVTGALKCTQATRVCSVCCI